MTLQSFIHPDRDQMREQSSGSRLQSKSYVNDRCAIKKSARPGRSIVIVEVNGGSHRPKIPSLCPGDHHDSDPLHMDANTFTGESIKLCRKASPRTEKVN
jgi:hypothetical protein